MGHKLQGWHSKILTRAGRTTQIDIVLNTMAVYQMQILKIPDTTIQQMERSLQRQCWWHKYNNYQPPHVVAYNSALLAKLAWQLLHDQTPLWDKVVNGKHFHFYHLKYILHQMIQVQIGYGRV